MLNPLQQRKRNSINFKSDSIKPLLTNTKGKEHYPLICLINFSSNTQKKLVMYCIANNIYTVGQLLALNTMSISDSIISLYSIQSAVIEINNALKTVKLSKKKIEQIDDATSYFRENDSQLYPLQDIYQKLLDSYSLYDPVKYRFIVYVMELCRENQVLRADVFKVLCTVSPILSTGTGKGTLSKTEKYKIAIQYELKEGVEGKGKDFQVLDIAPEYYDIEIKIGHAGPAFPFCLESFDQRTWHDLYSLYPEELINRLKSIYPIIQSEQKTSWEDAFYNVIKKDKRYRIISKHVLGKNYKEIARSCHVSEGKVKCAVHSFYDFYMPYIKAHFSEETSKCKDFTTFFWDKDILTIFGCKFPQKVLNNEFICGYNTVFTKDFYNKTKKAIIDIFNGEYYMDKDAFLNVLKPLFDNLESVMNEFIKILIKEDFLAEFNSVFILSKKQGQIQSKGKIASYIIHKYFKEGICVTSDEDVIKFNEHMVNDFGLEEYSKMDLNSVMTRTRKKVILINKSTYSHIDDVRFDGIFVKELISQIKPLLSDSKPPLSTFYIFKKNRAKCLKAGIKNGSMLYGILKDCYSDEFEYRKYFVYKKGSDTNKTLTDYCYEYIQAHPNGVTADELRTNFTGAGCSVYSDLIHNYGIKYDSDKKLYMPSF